MPKLKGLAKLDETASGWETNAPDDKFFDHTLDQYKSKINLTHDAFNEIAQKQQELDAAKNKYKDLLKSSIKLEQNIPKSIAGDVRYGDDSTLYESTGRIRRSERNSGLTRKKKNGGNTE